MVLCAGALALRKAFPKSCRCLTKKDLLSSPVFLPLGLHCINDVFCFFTCFLGGGFKYVFIFTPTNIVHLGWNRQLYSFYMFRCGWKSSLNCPWAPFGFKHHFLRQASPELPPEVGEELQSTPGSVGHPEICRRQCIYFLAGHCSNGDACTYCHLPHPQKSPKLDKRQRAIIHALNRKELLALILHLCRSKAEEIGMWVEAQEVIAILEAEAGNTPVPEMAERENRALRKTLSRMKLVIASMIFNVF